MNNQEQIRKRLMLLAFLFVITGVILVASLTLPVRTAEVPETPTLGDMIRAGKVPPPAYSTSTKEKLERSNGFQYLISYSDAGFEPTSATLKPGETVRFTNNSSKLLWVGATASPGRALYPGVQNGCGSSALDACEPIAPQDFWEFTFTHSGTWEFVNNLDKSKSGAVRVEVR